MRHHNTNRKFGRETNQRRALMRSLAEALIENGKIKTTEAKAKELRPFIERLITKSRVDTVTARRLVTSRMGGVRTGVTIKKLFADIAPRYRERAGGYTRITKLPARPGDASKMALIEFV